MKETALVRQIIEYLNYRGHKVWRNQSGGMYVPGPKRTNFIRMGPVGSPDIIGFEKGTGICIGIECKVGKNDRTEAQSQFGNEMLANNCAYLLAYSLDDVINYFDKRERMQALKYAV